MSLKTYIVDLKQEYKQGNHSLLSSFLIHQISECIKNKKQVLLFLNKRGFSQSLTCLDCGKVTLCKHCDIALTHHKNIEKNKTFLMCHLCGTIYQIPDKCDQCNSFNIKLIGFGTQQIEEILKTKFPKSNIQRMDIDTTRKKHDHNRIYQDLKDGKIDILLGTQMLAKGLDISNIYMVGILNADVGLHIPDFRASERIFQLITQVMGRTSRKESEGIIVIQTIDPKNDVIHLASKRDYKTFYEKTLEERRKFNYPPFSQIIKLEYVNRNKFKTKETAEQMYKSIQSIINSKLLLPTPNSTPKTQHSTLPEIFISPALVEKQHGKYHYNIILKGSNLHELLNELKLPLGFRINVDPESIV